MARGDSNNFYNDGKMLKVLGVLFAAHSLPKQLVSDNGPQFSSAEFETCMKANGIKRCY